MTTPPHSMRRWPLPRAHSDAIGELRRALRSAGSTREREATCRVFTERVREHGTPIIESDEPGWCRVTFVWIGIAPHGVALQLNRITDPLDVEDTLLERIEGSTIHALTLCLPDAWQGSYLFARLPRRVPPTLHAPIDMRLLAEFAGHAENDPFAREQIPSKAVAASGGLALPSYSAARGPAASRTALWRSAPLPVRALGTVRSPAGGRRLALHHRASPGADHTAPVVLFLDGEVWHTQFPLAAQLDARSAAGGLPPLHLLFLESGGPKQREFDYGGSPAESAELLSRVRHLAGGIVPVAPWVLVGQSLGGLFAMLAAVRHPEWVRSAVAQSPSLWWPSTTSIWQHSPGWFEEAAVSLRTGTPIAPILLEAGAIDVGVVETTRAAAAMLRSHGRAIGYHEHLGGHDILHWQSTIVDRVAAAVSATVRSRASAS